MPNLRCLLNLPQQALLATLASLLMSAAPARAQTTAAPTAASASTSSAPARSASVDAKNLAPGFAGLNRSDKVLLMPVDVELFSISGGGVSEPKADWTASAQRYMADEMRKLRMALRLDAVEMSEQAADEFGEQVGLHAAVASSIALHHGMGGPWALPTKAGKLDWRFDDAMQPLAAKTGARYGLFVWVRDSYASAERKAVMVGLALLGVGIAGGVQVGYASLVDLQTGQVVWFNRLARGSGDLREAASARESMDALLAGFPAVR